MHARTLADRSGQQASIWQASTASAAEAVEARFESGSELLAAQPHDSYCAFIGMLWAFQRTSTELLRWIFTGSHLGWKLLPQFETTTSQRPTTNVQWKR